MLPSIPAHYLPYVADGIGVRCFWQSLLILLRHFTLASVFLLDLYMGPGPGPSRYDGDDCINFHDNVPHKLALFCHGFAVSATSVVHHFVLHRHLDVYSVVLFLVRTTLAHACQMFDKMSMTDLNFGLVRIQICDVLSLMLEPLLEQNWILTTSFNLTSLLTFISAAMVHKPPLYCANSFAVPVISVPGCHSSTSGYHFLLIVHLLAAPYVSRKGTIGFWIALLWLSSLPLLDGFPPPRASKETSLVQQRSQPWDWVLFRFRVPRFFGLAMVLHFVHYILHHWLFGFRDMLFVSFAHIRGRMFFDPTQLMQDGVS